MSRIEIIDADRHLEDQIHIIYANNKSLNELVPKGKYGIVYCQCDYGGKCPNNPNKELIGAFNLCVIRIKDTEI